MLCKKVASCFSRFSFCPYDVNVNTLTACLQVVSSRLQLTECLLQKTQEDQGASEAVGDKMVNKAVSLMDSMASIVDR